MSGRRPPRGPKPGQPVRPVAPGVVVQDDRRFRPVSSSAALTGGPRRCFPETGRVRRSNSRSLPRPSRPPRFGRIVRPKPECNTIPVALTRPQRRRRFRALAGDPVGQLGDARQGVLGSRRLNLPTGHQHGPDGADHGVVADPVDKALTSDLQQLSPREAAQRIGRHWRPPRKRMRANWPDAPFSRRLY